MAVRICWSTHPREWMCQAAYDFEASLKEHFGSLPAAHRTDTLVVQLSVLTEPIAASGEKYGIVDESSDETMVLVAEPAELFLHSQPLISTRFGEWLIEKKMMGILISVGTLFLAFLDFMKPFGTKHIFNHPGPKEVAVYLESRFTMTATMVLICGCLCFASHVTPKGMIYACMRRFDMLQIVCSVAFYEIVYFAFEYATAHKYNVSTAAGYWPLFAFELISCSMAQVAVAMLDAWTRLSKGGKSCVSSAYISLLVLRYVIGKWFRKWGDTSWCLDEQRKHLCVEPKTLYCGALMNCIVFQSKFVLSYIRGHDFAILHALYVHKPNVQVHDLSDGEDPHILGKQVHSSRYGDPNSSDQQVSVCSCIEQNGTSHKPFVHNHTEEIQSGREETIDLHNSNHHSSTCCSGDQYTNCNLSHQSDMCSSGEQYTPCCRDDHGSSCPESALGVKLDFGFEVEDEQLCSGHQASAHSCHKVFDGDALEDSHDRVSARRSSLQARSHRKKLSFFYPDRTNSESSASSSADEGTYSKDLLDPIHQLSTWNRRESTHNGNHAESLMARTSSCLPQEEIRVRHTQHHPLQHSEWLRAQQLLHDVKAQGKTGTLGLDQREKTNVLEKE